jgi:UDP-glucose 4-epimerase
MKPQVLITGVTGHLGRAVVKRFVAEGIQVLGVGRDVTRLNSLEVEFGGGRLTTAACDLSDSEAVADLVCSYDSLSHLIHLAASIPSDLQDYAGPYRHNVDVTVLLLEHLRQRLQSVIYLSSFDVYAIGAALPITTTTHTVPATYYGASKLAGEKYVQVFGWDKGLKPTILRCSSIYGPGETIARAMKSFLTNAIENRPINIYGDGSELRDYIYVDDAATAVWQCFKEGVGGVFNLGGGRPVSIRELAELAISVAESSSPITYHPRIKERYDLYLDVEPLGKSAQFVPQVSLQQGMKRECESLRLQLGLGPPN